MKKLGPILALLVLAGALLPGPAEAKTCVLGVCIGGDVEHVTDNGYDPSIIIFCHWGDFYITNPDGTFTPRKDRWKHEHYVAEGTKSQADCGVDADIIYLRRQHKGFPGEHLVCRYDIKGETVWLTALTKPGVNKIRDTWTGNCALKLNAD